MKDSQAPQVVARRVQEVPVHSSKVAHLNSEYNHKNGWEEQYASTLPLKVKPTVYSSGHYVSKPQPHKSASSRVASGVCTQQIKPESMCYNPVHYDRENEIAARIQKCNIRASSPDPSADYTTVIAVGESGPKISENRRPPPPPTRRVSSSIYISPSNPSNSRTAAADSYDATVYRSNERPNPATIKMNRSKPKVFYAGNSVVNSQSSTRDRRPPSPARSMDELDSVRPSRSGYGLQPVNNVPAPPYYPSHQREHLKSFSTSTMSKPWRHSGSDEDSFASNARDLRQVSARIITDRPVCEKCRCVPIDRRQRLCAGCEQDVYQMHSNYAGLY